MGSNGRSAATTTGVMHILLHISVIRHPRSDMAKPRGGQKSMFYFVDFDINIDIRDQNPGTPGIPIFALESGQNNWLKN